MMPRMVLIAVSGGIVILAAAFLLRTPRLKTAEHSEPVPAERQKAVSAPSQRARENPDTFDWSKIESSDYREYIKNLRSIGTPEETIQDIIIADINKLFEMRRKQMIKAYPTPPGADTRIRPFTAVKERLKSDAQALQAEKRSLIKELLGDDVVVKEDPVEIAIEDVQQVLLGFLPPEKQESANQLLRVYDGRFQAEIVPLLDGPFNPEERATYIKLKEQKDQALLQILTPSEKEQYDLRFSQLSSFLHHRFEDYPMSETAFQELYRFAQKYDNDLDFYLHDHGDNDRVKANQDAQLAVNQKAKELSNGAIQKTPGGNLSHRYGF